MDEKKVKENIRRAREESNLTQKEAAQRMGLSRTAYRNIESGGTRIFSDHITMLARITGRSEEELVLGYPVRSEAGEDYDSLKEKYGKAQERIEELNEMLKLYRLLLSDKEK